MAVAAYDARIALPRRSVTMVRRQAAWQPALLPFLLTFSAVLADRTPPPRWRGS